MTDFHDKVAPAQQEEDPEEREARRRVEDLRGMMAQRLGRRFMWRLLEETGVYRTSFNESIGAMAFNEGQRNVGLRHLAEIQEHAPDHFLLMLKERTE